MGRLFVLSTAVTFFLCAASPAGAESIESLKAPGFSIQSDELGDILDPPDAEELVKDARRIQDRAYRLEMDLKMLLATLQDADKELDRISAGEAEREERAEFLLKFTLDAFDTQYDGAQWIIGYVIGMEHDMVAAPTDELVTGVLAMHAAILRADEAAKALDKAAAGLHARVAAMEELGGRTRWLDEKVSGTATAYSGYSGRMLERSQKVLETLPETGV